MKYLALLLGAGVVLGGCCAGKKNFAVDEPLPPVVEDESSLVAEEPEPPVIAPVAGDHAAPPPKPAWTQPAPVKPDPSKPQYPVAKPMPGKQGVVYSPYAPYAGGVNVSDFRSGQQVKCPFTGKIFIVP